MSKKLLFLYLILFISFCSCNNPEKGEMDIIIPPENLGKTGLSSLVDNIQIAPLRGDPNLLPLEADRVDFSKQLMVIGDFTFSQNVYAFENTSGKAINIPVKKGDGPNEIHAINDFWLDSTILYVLDGVKRNIVPFDYSTGSFKQLEKIKLELPLRRFAKTKSGFVGLTGGGQDSALVFLDQFGNLISSHLPNSIEFLLVPTNPFHKMMKGNETLVLFHSSFNPEIIRVDNGKPELYSTISYEGEKVKKPQNINFKKNQEGFNQFRETLINQPSLFNLMGFAPEQFILLFFIQDSARLVLSNSVKGNTFRIENLINDLSFDQQPFPKIIGTNGPRFLALIASDQINKEDLNFPGSELEKALKAYPDTPVFLLEFELKTF
ncbi:MAG: hypothetical protein HLUCCX10_16170 [Algoriphagus marincola HL-49]|uniref:6-bladed beta-propeller n=1 Tax=Algoriphagus marincola HL-49 TaxID=1305737 RepID=A0A0P7XZV0_9BACT|nr:MAG: hypothetical protein HLUCCX10_16170 [Algoriphagus marincola HL-49]